VRREERARWRELMRQHHYLGFENIIGESLWYVASVREEWVALLGWGSAALKCGVRDQWIGWDRTLQWRRLHLVANNVRFLMLPFENADLYFIEEKLAQFFPKPVHDWLVAHARPSATATKLRTA
jgi:hypothetical protein